MSLTLIKVPDAEQNAGVSQVEVLYQAQPGSSDYPSGGYTIPGALTTSSNVVGNFGAEFCYAVDVQGGNAASSAYPVQFVFPSGSFGTTPGPATSVTMQVGPSGGAPAGIPLGLGSLSTTSTLSAVASKVGTITVANTLSANQFVYLQSFTQAGALNGTIVRVASATTSAFTFNLGSAANISSGADTTGTFQLVQAGPGNLLQLGATATITNSLATAGLLTMTSTLNPPVGSFVYIDNLTNGATANGVIVQVASTSSTQFAANWNGTSLTFSSATDAGNVWQLVTAGNALVTTGTWANITNSVATASSAGTAGVISLSAVNNFQAGNIVVTQGLTNGAKINGTVTAVISTSLTNALFKLNEQIAAISTAADAGVSALLVTGNPTTFPQVSPGTNLSSCAWFLDFLNGGI
jgi:hypothetical protein